MKVFKFDTQIGKKGEQVADIFRPCATGGYVYNDDVKLPGHNKATTKWAVINEAENLKGNLVEFDFPVCFCMGQFSCGTEDPIWEWFVLLPKKAA
jgi:hypothetical protein